VGAQLGDHHSTPLSDHAPPSIKQRVTDASTPAERHNRPPHQGVRTSRKNTLLIDWRTPWCPSRPYRSHDKELDHRFSSVCVALSVYSISTVSTPSTRAPGSCPSTHGRRRPSRDEPGRHPAGSRPRLADHHPAIPALGGPPDGRAVGEECVVVPLPRPQRALSRMLSSGGMTGAGDGATAVNSLNPTPLPQPCFGFLDEFCGVGIHRDGHPAPTHLPMASQ